MKAGAMVGRIAYGLILTIVGAALAIGGGKLLTLGGSWYYLPAGLAAVASGILVLRGNWRRGAEVYLLLMAITLVWSLIEAGLDGWALMPRLVSPFVLGLPFLIGALASGKGTQRSAGLATLAVTAILVAAVWVRSSYDPVEVQSRKPVAVAGDAGAEWPLFGGSGQGRHFSALDQVNRANVGRLEKVWSIPLGPFPVPPFGQNQSQPIVVDGSMFNCTPFSDVIASDPETGKVLWTYEAKADVSGHYTTKCRGVTYYALPGAEGPCSNRVYTATTDGQLVALDATSGKLCPSFGDGGKVNLMRGIRQRNPGYYRVTSAPTLVRGNLVIGSAVADGQYVGEPSGVVRAFDAATGKLAWAWDVDNPDDRGEPAEGEDYNQGTPNSWGPMSADEELGIVYAPIGNATPDYYGGHRSKGSNEYASSVVALDAETGEVRWHFQTTHYDVWDYDVASQPVLFDLRRDGKVIPALLQPTKRGQTFILDRRTGEPLFPIEERPAPQDGAVEKLSPTQPWSPGMPNLGGPRLTESRMWGISALDQLWCRVRFREARYDGSLTPPGVTWSIADPGYIGGTNWGSFSIDTSRQLGFTLSNRMVNYIRLIPRDDPAAKGLKADSASNLGGPVAQEGTPYAAHIQPFLSPIGVPCQQPPHGLINAIDLQTGKMAWSRPIGTARDSGPMGIPSRLPITFGTWTFGGTMSTAGGLVFAGGSQDHSFRAFDSETGEMLFEADLPGTSATRPMTFLSPEDGRQYVVVTSDAGMKGDTSFGAITAFALPK